MKYTTLDNNGIPMAFYSDDIHTNIPKEAIEITDEQWLECINNQGQRKFVDGILTEYVYAPTKEELLAIAEVEAKATKLQALNSITVTTTSGKVFDGRDIDQQRMVSAIISADVVGLTETYWKLADNSVELITLDELKESLALSIQTLGQIIVGA